MADRRQERLGAARPWRSSPWGCVMPTKVIRVASHDLGRNAFLADGFVLGTLPGGGYGIRWRRGSAGPADTGYWSPWEPGGLGATMYWFPWEPPQDPVRIAFEG